MPIRLPKMINLAEKANLLNYTNYLNPSKCFPTDFKIFLDVNLVFLNFFMSIRLPKVDELSYKGKFGKLHQPTPTNTNS